MQNFSAEVVGIFWKLSAELLRNVNKAVLSRAVSSHQIHRSGTGNIYRCLGGNAIPQEQSGLICLPSLGI